jgi:hypothetical protein
MKGWGREEGEKNNKERCCNPAPSSSLPHNHLATCHFGSSDKPDGRGSRRFLSPKNTDSRLSLSHRKLNSGCSTRNVFIVQVFSFFFHQHLSISTLGSLQISSAWVMTHEPVLLLLHLVKGPKAPPRGFWPWTMQML